MSGKSQATIDEHRDYFARILKSCEDNMPGRTDFYGAGSYDFGRRSTLAKLSLLRLLPELARLQHWMHEKDITSGNPLDLEALALFPSQTHCGRRTIVCMSDGEACLRIDFDHFEELHREISVRAITPKTAFDDDAPVSLSAAMGRTSENKNWEMSTNSMDRGMLSLSMLFFELCRHLRIPVSEERLGLSSTFFDNFENLLEEDGLPGITFEQVMLSMEQDTASAILKNLPAKLTGLSEDLATIKAVWGGSHLKTRDGLSSSGWEDKYGNTGIVIEVENPGDQFKGLIVTCDRDQDGGNETISFFAFSDVGEFNSSISAIADFLQIKSSVPTQAGLINPDLSFNLTKGAGDYQPLYEKQRILNAAPDLIERVAFAAKDVSLKKSRSRLGRLVKDEYMFSDEAGITPSFKI